MLDLRRERGLDWYASHFSPEPGVEHWGESTRAYLYFRSARAGISEVLPEAKLVVLLRDPVRRAHSHFWHAKRTGRERVDTFEEGLALEKERLERGFLAQARYSYTDRGFYIDQLEDLVARHGTENVHVMLLHDLMHARVPTLERLLGFLDVDTSVAHGLDPVWAYRFRSLPQGADGSTAPYPPMERTTKGRLAELFEPYTMRLERWLERDLSHWVRA